MVISQRIASYHMNVILATVKSRYFIFLILIPVETVDDNVGHNKEHTAYRTLQEGCCGRITEIGLLHKRFINVNIQSLGYRLQGIGIHRNLIKKAEIGIKYASDI